VSSFAGRVQFWLHPFDRFLDGLADELLLCLSSVSHAPAPVVSDAAYLNLGACNLKDAQKRPGPAPGGGKGDGLPILDTRNPSSRHCCTGRRISHRAVLSAVKRACEISSRKLLPGRFQVVPLSAASELFGKKLQAWADERRMDVREPKVRRLLNAGKTLEASQLRSEIFKEMDLASRQIWETIPGSSAERPPWKTVTPGPYTPSK